MNGTEKNTKYPPAAGDVGCGLRSVGPAGRAGGASDCIASLLLPRPEIKHVLMNWTEKAQHTLPARAADDAYDTAPARPELTGTPKRRAGGATDC
jgi:hypothetical protein